jgi:HAD superfamily hydrolase (TIGR01458 family)
MATDPTMIRGLLVDLDGVCHTDGWPVSGAEAALEAVAKAGLPCRFLTNTTTRSRAALWQQLASMGFSIPEEAIFSAPRACARHLARQNLSARLVVAEAVREDFAGCRIDELSPQVVVIGDIGRGWNFTLIDSIFRQVMGGAKLIALHKNRYWQTAGGLSIDIGAFVTGLEYATGAVAEVVGKPSPMFFQQAIDDIGLHYKELAIIGDDIETDIGGGQACGLTGILVRTGKYRQEQAEKSAVVPDHVIASIAQVPELLRIACA